MYRSLARGSNRQRTLESPVVEPQCRIDDPRPRRDPAHDVFRIGHAWNSLRADEGYNLNMVEARIGQSIDQFDFALGRNVALLELKSLARTFFLDMDAFWQVAHCSILPSRNFGCRRDHSVSSGRFTVRSVLAQA